jgi:hypothetical protein
MADQFHAPPRAFLGYILGAVIGYIYPAVDRLDAIAAIP